MDQHRITGNAGQRQERGEQRRLVAADAVAVFERQADSVRLVPRRHILGGDSHVADLLRNELEETPDLLVARCRTGNQLLNLLLHLRSRLLQRRLAELPVPARDIAPLAHRAEQHALHLRVERRHVRFREHLRHVAHLPRVQRATIRLRCSRIVQGIRHCRAQHRMLDRQFRRRGNLIIELHDRQIVFEDRIVAPRIGNARLAHDPAGRDMADIADLHAGHGEDQHLIRWVVDVRAHLAGINHHARVGRDIDGHRGSIRLDDLRPIDKRRAVMQVEGNRDRLRIAAALFRQHLGKVVVPRHGRARFLITLQHAILNQHAIRVRETFSRHRLGADHDLRGIQRELRRGLRCRHAQNQTKYNSQKSFSSHVHFSLIEGAILARLRKVCRWERRVKSVSKCQ